jgi:ubiquitin carboxyl-terminal hydrolase 12/46
MGGVESTPSITRTTEYVGLQNFGNTCYCNSVIQALYHCEPFREKVMEYGGKDDILTLLGDLFDCIDQKKRKGSLNCLKKFILKLRKDNELFNNRDQHDAHEFLNFMVNTVDDLLRLDSNGDPGVPLGSRKTWVDDIFKGTLTNETKCLCCETVRRHDEDFLDLSVDIDQNTSITSSLKKFSKSELLCRESKYFCEVCCSKQEATKSLRVQKLPQILVLHLKRFKFMEQVGRFTKLSYRVAFPFELKLFNTVR